MKRILGTLTIIITVICGGWLYMAQEFETRITQWAFNMNQLGHKVTHDPIKISGFPLKIHLAIDNVQVVRSPGSASECNLSGKSMSLTSSIFAPLTPTYQILGLMMSKLDQTSGKKIFSVEAVDGTAYWDSKSHTLEGDLRATGARWGNDKGEFATAREWKAELRSLGADKNTEQPTFSVISSLKNVELPESCPLTERKITMVYLDALLKGPFIPHSRDRLVEWSKTGVMDIRSFTIQGGQLDAQAKGQLHLNETLVPEGNLTILTPTLDPVINLMAVYGSVSKGAATALNFIQGLGLSLSDSKESKLTLQVFAKDGVLTVGGVPLAKLKPVM